MPEPEPYATYAKGRVGLRGGRAIARRLITTDVERAVHDRAVGHRGTDASVQCPLFVETRGNRSAKEKQLSAQQADTLRAGRGRLLHLVDRARVPLDHDRQRERRQVQG